MILTDIEIRDMVKNFNKYNLPRPLIKDFKEERLQGSSYDISISNKITVYDSSIKSIDLRNQDTIDSIYKEVDISQGYVFKPNEYILVRLNEYITLPTNIIAHVRPRTRYTRLGIILTPQHCNQTYSGILQLGLYNATPYKITIVPNLKIGQLVFEELKSIPTQSKWYKNSTQSIYNNENKFIGSIISKELEEEADEFYQKLIIKLNNKIKENNTSNSSMEGGL